MKSSMSLRLCMCSPISPLRSWVLHFSLPCFWNPFGYVDKEGVYFFFFNKWHSTQHRTSCVYYVRHSRKSSLVSAGKQSVRETARRRKLELLVLHALVSCLQMRILGTGKGTAILSLTRGGLWHFHWPEALVLDMAMCQQWTFSQGFLL